MVSIFLFSKRKKKTTSHSFLQYSSEFHLMLIKRTQEPKSKLISKRDCIFCNHLRLKVKYAIVHFPVIRQMRQSNASTCLVIDLMLAKMLLQLALRAEDLTAYRALLFLEFSITETFHFCITRISL